MGGGKGRPHSVHSGLHHHSSALGIHAGGDGCVHDHRGLRTAWRNPILVYSAFEKAFLVYLVAVNVSRPYARGLWVGSVMDATVVLYTIGYFAVCGFKSPSS